MAARAPPKPAEADGRGSRRPSAEETVLIPPVELQSAATNAKAIASVASGELEQVLQQHAALVQELDGAAKADESRLNDEIATLEPIISERRKLADDAKQKLKHAERAVKAWLQRRFLHIQTERNLNQSRDSFAAYIEYRHQALGSFEEQRLQQRSEALELHRSRVEQSKALARSKSFELFESSILERERSWSNAWSRRPDSFPPLQRRGRTPWQRSKLVAVRDMVEVTDDPLETLKKALGQNLPRVIDMFKKWDVNCDGAVSIEELQMALAAVGVPHVQQTLDRLFHELDADKNSSIDFQELNLALNKHVPASLPSNQICLQVPQRKEGKRERGGTERQALKMLKIALQSKLDKVALMFGEWDLDGNGVISKREMNRALAALCIPIEPVAVDMLFEELDMDESGGIDFNEMHKLLRREMTREDELVEAKLIAPAGSNWSMRQLSAGMLPRPKSTVGFDRSVKGGMKRATSESARTMYLKRMDSFSGIKLKELMREKEEALRAAQHTAPHRPSTVSSSVLRPRGTTAPPPGI
jgi:Ca2+-binding EF-hand superfamily protein